ncbi:MAG: NADH:flavin oxidoreductase [Candidatus Kariarchaeaceae archaeon]|jgi:2,4-dienoyl-CoA reductase-like NADH-dependent reductase (Old Yellow Enzyme family)
MKSSALFNPGNIGQMNLKNRFVRSATAEFGANDDGTITDDYIKLYSDLGRGEIGLIIQGHVYISDEGKAHDKMAGIAHDYHIDGLKEITGVVHKSNTSKIVAQLNHGGAISESKKTASMREDREAVIMTEEDIEKVIHNFKQAAVRAKKANYDGIQIHGAHGYLVSQFLSSKTNKRSDTWGGNLEGRANLLLTVFREIRSEVGSDYPILVKINGSDDPSIGYPIEEGVKVCGWLAEEGIDGIEVSGMKSTRTIKDQTEEGYFSHTGKQIRKSIGDTPLILVGGHRSLNKMEELCTDFVDYISICRPFIREPDLVSKFGSGKERADCISCTRCIKSPDIIRCMVLRDKLT